jgi:hypothetical protein
MTGWIVATASIAIVWTVLYTLPLSALLPLRHAFSL